MIMSWTTYFKIVDLFQSEITSDTKKWKCRGPMFYNNQLECDEYTLKNNDFKYSCICLRCIANGGVDYCANCAFKESINSGFYTLTKHDCGLTPICNNSKWKCSCDSYLGYTKIDCFSGLNTSTRYNQIRFNCKKCNFNICELCFINYR